MNKSITDVIKQYGILYSFLILISVIVIPSLLGSSVISGAIIEAGWCSVGQNICLLKVHGIIALIILTLGLFFQFAFPKLLSNYKTWLNRERLTDLKFDWRFKSPYFILLVKCPVSQLPFIRSIDCSIVVYPELNFLPYLDLKRIEGHSIRLPIKKILWVFERTRVNAFVFHKREEVFSLFGGEQYSQNPIFGFGNYVFHIGISGRNILGKRVSDRRYIFVEYNEENQFPKITTRRFLEIDKDERNLIRKYENRYMPDFSN